MTTSTRPSRTRTGVLTTCGLLVAGLFGTVACGSTPTTAAGSAPGVSSGVSAGTGSRVTAGTAGGMAGAAPGVPQQPAPSANSPVQAADAVAAALSGDLNSGFLSPGQTYGGPFTEGTVVHQVEAQGGVLLSMGATPIAGGGNEDTATVMLGIGPSAAAPTPACFRYTFGVGPGSVQRTSTACPDAAAVAHGRALLRTGPQVAHSGPAQVAPGDFPVTVAGVRTLLHDEFVQQRAALASAPLATATATTPSGDPVLVAAVRVAGVCTFVRLGSSATISSWVALWQAPLDDQSSCHAADALAADTLYGRDPAQEG
jgi:hypothetical protein